MTIDQEIDALKGMQAALPAIESAIDERDRLRRELAECQAELKLWKPMTAEEADEALAEIADEDCPPLSEERLDELVALVTDPTYRPTEPEHVRMMAQIQHLSAKLHALRTTVILVRDGGAGQLPLEARKELDAAVVKSLDLLDT